MSGTNLIDPVRESFFDSEEDTSMSKFKNLTTRELSKLAKLANMLAVGHGQPQYSEEWAQSHLETMTGESIYWECLSAAFSDALESLGFENEDCPDALIDLDPNEVEQAICDELGIGQSQLDNVLVAHCLEVHGDEAQEGDFTPIRNAAKSLSAELYAEKDARLSPLIPDEYHRISGRIHPYYSQVALHGAPISEADVPASKPAQEINLGDYGDKLDGHDQSHLCEVLTGLLPNEARDYQIDLPFLFACHENFNIWLSRKQEGFSNRRIKGSFDGLDDEFEF